MLRLQRGNKKLSKRILTWSLPPGIACLGASEDCIHDCYARILYMRPVVKEAWDRNLRLAKRPKDMVPEIVAEVQHAYMRGLIDTVRIHVAGDFISEAYARAWMVIAMTCPYVKFYGYTRLPWAHAMLNTLDNVNIKMSTLSDGENNFGDRPYLEKLYKKYGRASIYTCIATAPGVKNLVCGENCSFCMRVSDAKQRVVFFKH